MNDSDLIFLIHWHSLPKVEDSNNSCLLKNPQDLAELLSLGDLIASGSPADTPLAPVAIVTTMGCAHFARFMQHEQLVEIQTAIECLARVVSWVPEHSPDGHIYLGVLGFFYLASFFVTGEPSDLDRSLAFTSQEVSSNKYPTRPDGLILLGYIHWILYQAREQLLNLDSAIECYLKALSLIPNGSPEACEILERLSRAYFHRYKHVGELADLDVATKYQIQGVSLLSDEHPSTGRCLAYLRDLLIYRYIQLGHLTDLDMGIQCISRLLSILPNDDDLTTPQCLWHLGVLCMVRHQRLGELPDLDASINYQLQLIPYIQNGSPSKFKVLSMLGSAYGCRFRHLGQLSDLDLEIKYLSQAILLTPDNYPERAALLGCAGGAYGMRFSLLGELTDYDMSFLYTNQAVHLESDASPEKKAVWLGNLGSLYRLSYSRSDLLADIEMVIKCNDRAISLVPNNSPRRPQFLGGQGQGYFLRYLHQRKREDLQQAIQSSSLAVSSTPDNSPDKVSRLSDLSVLLECRLSVFENDADTAAQRMSCLKQMAKSRRGDPEKRMNAAMKWAGLCAASDPPSSLEAFQCYMSLIPEMAWLGMTAKDRYKRVSRMADTILDPPSLAVAFGQREAALEWLEQGRSIVWNQLLRLRTPTELPDTDASLASELMNVAYELQKTASLRPLIHHTADQEHLLEQSAQHHRCLTERWESLVRQAKSLPGLNEQLGPKKASTLVQSARAGAVVVVMASMIGVIALVIPQGGQNISDLLLGNSLLYDQLANAHKQLNLKRHNRARMERKFTTASKPETAGHYDMLGMLWNDIAWPVLDFLGYTEALPADQLPRITWCTTGPLSFLPLHAAGDYTKPKCSLFDFAVSSYTPTLSALLEQPHIPADFSGVTLVGQEITAGFPRLPGTTDELNRISRQTQQTPITRLEGGEATCSAVLDAMQKHSWVHLACHASQNLADPISSAFHLHDGPLDLAAITDKHLKHADLAFLSACQTATGDKELSEEAVHLAAGMLMAGYRTVIATMWPIRDQDAPLVAERFYEYMLKDGVPDSRKAARALHYAVGCLREKVGVDAYMHWAPYIHMGN